MKGQETRGGAGSKAWVWFCAIILASLFCGILSIKARNERLEALENVRKTEANLVRVLEEHTIRTFDGLD